MPHQVETVEYAIKNPYSILALEQGLGKTICCLAVHERVGGNTLIVVPSYLIFNWISEIKKFLGDRYTVTAFKKGSEIYPLFDTDICLISYDLSMKAESLFEWADTIIYDEANYLKEMTTKRTQFAHKNIYENSVKRVHLLTGTPIKNRVMEYYSLIAICNYSPSVKKSEFLENFPEAISFADYFSFREEYTMEKWTSSGFGIVPVIKWFGIQRTDELKKYLVGHYIRFNSKDILDLPPIVYKDVILSDKEDTGLLEAYLKMQDSESVAPDAKAKAALEKVPMTISYVEDLLKEVGEIVIYSDHVASTQAIAKHFKVTPITGRTPMETRKEIAEDFQRGSTKVIAATIKSFSTGVNLTRANNMVFNDYSWVPGDMSQAVFRINRIGQDRQCIIHRMLGSPQDEYILKTISQKEVTIKEAT